MAPPLSLLYREARLPAGSPGSPLSQQQRRRGAPRGARLAAVPGPVPSGRPAPASDEVTAAASPSTSKGSARVEGGEALPRPPEIERLVQLQQEPQRVQAPLRRGLSRFPSVPREILEGVRVCAQELSEQSFDPEGELLADFLAAADIALIKVRYLRELAASGQLLTRRQDLPDEPPEVSPQVGLLLPRAAPSNEVSLREHLAVRGEELKRHLQLFKLFVISHAWLSAEHPDPTGVRLQDIVEELEYLGACNQDLVFLDYCCLYQLDKRNKEYREAMAQGRRLPSDHPALRTARQERCFQEALAHIDIIFASGVSQVVVLPIIHDVSNSGPRHSAYRQAYKDRGFCCFEFAVAKHFGRVVNCVPEMECFSPSALEASVAAGEVRFCCPWDAGPVLELFRRTSCACRLAEILAAIAAGKEHLCRADVLAALSALSPHVRWQVVEALGAARCPGFAEDVSKLLTDTDAVVRAAACTALPKLGAVGGVFAQVVAARLADAHSVVRAAACSALAAMGRECVSHVEAIAACFSDSSWEVREAALKAMAAIGKITPAHAEAVAECLNDTNPIARMAALRVLFEMGPSGKSHADLVWRISQSDKYVFVRDAARLTLRKIGRLDLIDEMPL